MPSLDPQREAQALSKLVEEQSQLSPPVPRGAGGTPGGVGTFFGGFS